VVTSSHASGSSTPLTYSTNKISILLAMVQIVEFFKFQTTMIDNKIINNRVLTRSNCAPTYNSTQNNNRKIQISHKYSHQTHTFHKPLTFQKMFKTPTTSNKVLMSCTKVPTIFNTVLTCKNTSATCHQTHISHKFFKPFTKHLKFWQTKNESFNNLQQCSSL
jgi:hypothetical protein